MMSARQTTFIGIPEDPLRMIVNHSMSDMLREAVLLLDWGS